MLADQTYRQWTAPFNPGGSYYEGNWQAGSKMLFLGPGEDGKLSGMVSTIADNRQHEYISIEHLGEVIDGQEVMDSEGAKAWAGSHENYTLTEKDGITTVAIDLESTGMSEEYKTMFAQMWPPALAKLKDLAEK